MTARPSGAAWIRVRKYNPYHDRLGRFAAATSTGAAVRIGDVRAREVAARSRLVGGGESAIIGVAAQEKNHRAMLTRLQRGGFSDSDMAAGHRALEEWGGTVRRSPEAVAKFRQQLLGQDGSPAGKVVAEYARDTRERLARLHPSGTVTLYRGVHMEQGRQLVAGPADLRINGASSWSASRAAAEKFGRVVEAQVSTRDIGLTYHAAPWRALHPDEAEYVVLASSGHIAGMVR